MFVSLSLNEKKKDLLNIISGKSGNFNYTVHIRRSKNTEK